MGENEKFGLNLWYAGQPIMSSVADDIGIDASGKLRYKPDTSCGTIPKHDPSHAERMASLKAEVDALAKEYKPIVDKFMEEIYESSQKPIELLSEETAQQINEVFKDFGKAVSSVFPLPSTKSTKRKHYKPKFTL